MTATDTDIDLEQLLDGLPKCEILHRHNDQWIPCGKTAEWLICLEKARCGHDVVDSVLACDPCAHRNLNRGWARCIMNGCDTAVWIRQIIKL